MTLKTLCLKSLSLAAVVGLVATVGPPVAGASTDRSSDPGPTVEGESSSDGDVGVVVSDDGAGPGRPGGGGGSHGRPGYVLVVVDLSKDPAGGNCSILGWVPEATYVPPIDTGKVLGTFPTCVFDAAVATSAVETVEDYLARVHLPVPRPVVPPGRAVTGMRMFLEAGTALDAHYEFAVDPDVLVLDARSTLVVDWGDGTVAGPYTSTGGPWPDGDVTHVYEVSGPRTLVVTQTWSVSWVLGGQSGVITTIDGSPIATTAAMPLAVGQVQTIIL